ncbi:MAG TPA: lysophospholipid acyltransferase family protein [Polyangiaceae bacterium]|nr:lysophospholipid acyltransferase family protein [Polyangiaceae bacterium]
MASGLANVFGRLGGRGSLAEEVHDRIDRLELPFSRFGADNYGISKKHLFYGFMGLGLLYKEYFRVRAYGTENVPKRGRAMLIGNHSGGIAIDGAMVIASMFFDLEPPRLAQGMVEKFINRVPLASLWANRVGQFTGLPEHAVHLLEDERLLMVFPEGARGTAKLYWERNSLIHFGSGFMRLALQTHTPIIPFGFIGGGDALPTVMNAVKLGQAVGVPYLPISAYVLPVPLPVQLSVHYGEPMLFDGTGNEDDATIEHQVGQVKARIAELIEHGERVRAASYALPPRREEP